MTSLPDGGIVLGLEPLDGVRGGDLVAVSNLGLASSATGNTETGTGPAACQNSLLFSRNPGLKEKHT